MLRRDTFWSSRWKVRALLLVLTAAALGLSMALWLTISSAGVAHGQPSSPPNDLSQLGMALGQTPTPAPVQHNPEPPLQPAPRAVCGPGSNPLAGVQGRETAAAISSPAAAHGYTCNLSLVSHQGSSGGFKVYRYVDPQGHVCAFYDTALLFPINALHLFGPSLGVAVLDMSDPAHPVQTASLTTPPMDSPHESLSLSPTRGLLAAVLGNPDTAPGLVAIYDVKTDCRHPILDALTVAAPFGHEGNFSPDGRTFWVAGTAVKSLTAIDVSDPHNPHPIWQGNEYSHGLTLSDDGNRAYVADPIDGNMLILDTSQIQSRALNPQAREISRLTWHTVTIPQNAIPITMHGKPYVLEFDEYAFRFNSQAPPDTVGAARLIDISDETHPRVVSNLRLEVDQPAQHHAASSDPGGLFPLQGYAAHYCSVPTEVDPQIVACSFIASGLRVFNISDPVHPREVAYFLAPPAKAPENGYNGSNYAMSKPAFDVARHDIWYSDGGTGFYVLHLSDSAWSGIPSTPSGPSGSGTPGCPAPKGRLHGKRLGPVTLDQRRATVRHELGHVSTRRRGRIDSKCLSGGSIRVGYATAKLVRPSHRRSLAGRAVLITTSNPHYSLAGARPGAKLRRRPRHSLRLRMGASTWYVVRGARSDGVVEVRHGVVQAVGIADKRLASRRSAAHSLLSTLA